DLRRVRGGKTHKVGVAVLPPRRIGTGERVLPAEPVPIIDMERQGQQVRPAGELGEQSIGGRAGRAALGGEQLGDGGGVRRLQRRSPQRPNQQGGPQGG